MKPLTKIILIIACVQVFKESTVYAQNAGPCPNGHKFRDAECLTSCGMGSVPDSSGGATSGQAQQQQERQAIANALIQGFNNMQERNRKWEEFQEARRERERQWEREWDEIERQRSARQAEEAARASAPTITAQPNLPSYVRYDENGDLVYSGPHTSHATGDCPCLKYPLKLPGYENRKSASPVTTTAFAAPKPEPYTPPSLGAYLSDDAKQFGADVLLESATILAEQLNTGADNLRDAAKGGIRDLPGRTYDAIADDLLDSGKDAAKDAAMNLLSEDNQIAFRAMDIPLSILTRNWDAIQEAWAGQNSLWARHVSNPLDSFTVEPRNDRQDDRIAYLRKRIRDCEENIQYYTRRIARLKESLGTPGLHRLEYEYRENEIRSDTKYLQEARRRKAEYEALLQDLSR